jgi:hypothetical protein
VSGVGAERVDKVDTSSYACNICPSRNLADGMVLIVLARILSVFTMSKAKDVNDDIIELEIEFVTALTRYVLPTWLFRR